MKNGILYYSKNNYRWIVFAEKHLASNKLHALYCSKNLLQNLLQKYAFLRLEKRVIQQKNGHQISYAVLI